MLDFVTAEEASLDEFLSVSAASQYHARHREYAETLLRQGTTKPSWCVVGREAETPAARAALWALPEQPTPTDIVLLDADWGDPALAGARELLEHVHRRAADLGATELSHHVDSPPGPPQYQEHEPARLRLLADCGYELLRDGVRWSLRAADAPEPSADTSLSFRTLADVGEDAFVEAIAATYEGTRDSWINRTIEEHGLAGAARSDFQEYKELEYRPEWWELAYADGGKLAGVIMAARNPSVAVIGYVGVVPEQRGRGFAAQLVRRGTASLVAAGADEIRGDCDRDNVAMVKAFERAGYERTARRTSHRRLLAS